MHYSVRVQVSPGNVQPYDVKALGPDNPLQGVAPSELNFILFRNTRFPITSLRLYIRCWVERKVPNESMFVVTLLL